MDITSFCSKYQLHESKRLATLASFMNYIYQFQNQTTLVPTWNQCKHIPRPVGSDKYLVFNQRQLWSHSAHAHKLQDCSHIPMRGDIIDSVSANNRWIINVSFLLWLCQPMRTSGRITSANRYKIFVSSDKGCCSVLLSAAVLVSVVCSALGVKASPDQRHVHCFSVQNPNDTS